MRISGICSKHGYYKGGKCSECIVNNKSVPYVFMRTERGYRTDMEFSTTTVEKDIEDINRRNNG
jgi:hypothetical protein|tara:strand:- start:472 stop:663 length:192 start_codon:yes stop_codon:yes gene_type:complete